MGFSSASLPDTDIAFPLLKARSAGFGATAQLRHLAFSGLSLRRRRHESVMNSVIGRGVEELLSCLRHMTKLITLS